MLLVIVLAVAAIGICPVVMPETALLGKQLPVTRFVLLSVPKQATLTAPLILVTAGSVTPPVTGDKSMKYAGVSDPPVRGRTRSVMFGLTAVLVRIV